MSLITHQSAPDRLDSYSWWQGIKQTDASSSHQIDILPVSVLDTSWCSMRHVSLGTKPHKVNFCRPSHTILIFDEGSFVDGERRVNGVRARSQGPLDRGIDIVPANFEFDAIANSGSNIESTLITIYDEEINSVLGICSDGGLPLKPDFNLQGDLLNVLAARLRQAALQEQNAAYSETLISLLFQEILRTQNENHSQLNHRCSGGLSPRTRRIARDFLHENLSKSIDLHMLANYVGLSRFHFTREFKASFGVPPHKYLLNLRVQKASELLRETRLPITEIALDVGFSCSSDFSRAFKQIMNCSPRDFRSLNRPVQISESTIDR
jgi:AraC-like DNA-binding protein